MEIRELVQKTSVPAKTIRYYEDIGLLPPPARKPNGYRDYADADVERLKLVAGARRMDIPLAEIQEILDLRDRQEPPCFRLLEIIAQKRSEIQVRIEQLKQMDAELSVLRDLGMSFPKDDIEGKHCVCHLVSQKANKD
jgi:DNA-binding transcriptional MerR regulator